MQVGLKWLNKLSIDTKALVPELALLKIEIKQFLLTDAFIRLLNLFKIKESP